LGIREPSSAWAKTILGPVPHAKDNPSSCSQGWDHAAHRLAHLPTHLFLNTESKQDGHQSNPRITSSCVQSGHVGHVYAGASSSSAAVHNGCRLRRVYWASVPLLCACAKSTISAKTLAHQCSAFAQTGRLVPFLCLYKGRMKNVSC
jgi:hypothetical protein